MTAAPTLVAAVPMAPTDVHDEARTSPAMTNEEARQAYLEQLVAKAPPLSPAQRAKVGALLAPVAIPVRKGVRHGAVAA